LLTDTTDMWRHTGRWRFGGSDNLLRIEKQREGFTLDGFTFASAESRSRVDRIPLPREVAARIIQDTVSALSFEEAADGNCRSTTTQFAHITANCDGDTLSDTFKTNSCEYEGGGKDPHEYQYALELARICQRALDGFAKHESQLTRAEERAERRKWSTLYADGYRVRHDPIEEWELDGGEAP
jgi:hypothetical protein